MMKRTMIMLVLAMAGIVCYGQADGGLDAIESGVTLKLAAPIGPDGIRKVFLEVQTNDVYECSNFGVEYHADFEAARLAVQLKGVRRTNPCAPGMAAALGRIDLTGMKKGSYEVRFTINRQVFKAKLAVADSSYDFRIPSENPILFRIINSHLNLIPENAIWGKCMYNDVKQQQVALQFMAELAQAGAVKTQLPAGSYDEFYLHRPGVTEPKMLAGDRYEFPFVYHYVGDAVVLHEIMNAFRDRLKISLRTTKGETYTNF
jgi:hypothetical protein